MLRCRHEHPPTRQCCWHLPPCSPHWPLGSRSWRATSPGRRRSPPDTHATRYLSQSDTLTHTRPHHTRTHTTCSFFLIFRSAWTLFCIFLSNYVLYIDCACAGAELRGSGLAFLMGFRLWCRVSDETKNLSFTHARSKSPSVYVRGENTKTFSDRVFPFNSSARVSQLYIHMHGQICVDVIFQ